MYPKSLNQLIEDFNKLPGIGLKTAERLALFVVTQMNNEHVRTFSKHLDEALDTLMSCKDCHMLSDEPLCSICKDTSRDKTIMVVADVKDVISLEQMKTYHGYYHVLGGVIDFSRGITDTLLNIDTLKARLKDYQELIIATNSTVEGELTAQYIKALFSEEKIELSRLAYGLPVGTDFKYADAKTLAIAVENRKKF
jgi:recombination protein RecR